MRDELRRGLAIVIAVAAIVDAGAALYWATSYIAKRPRTDAAEIDAPAIHISPTVPGRVIAVDVGNDAIVKKGDTLFEIDPEPYRLRLEQARAEAEAARSEVEQGGRNIAGEEASAAAAEQQIRRAHENLGLAQATLDRLEPLLPKGYVSAQQVDQARAARNDAEVSLKQAEQQAKGASGVVGTTATRQAQLIAAEAAVALAERDLANAKVRAPFEGRTAGFKLTVGEYVATAEPLGTLIDVSRWEAVADFRETELAAVHIGAAADVYAMTDRNRVIHGEVESIGSGVRSDEKLELLGLPMLTRSLNWVRVAKRYPVTVKLINPPQDLMRLGASAVVVLGSESAHEPDAGHP